MASVKKITPLNTSALIGGAMVISLLLGGACAYYLPGQWGLQILTFQVNISAILFGVFGIWLGMFYNPGVVYAMNGKKDNELRIVANDIIQNAKRFEIVFRGMRTTAGILVFSMIAHSLPCSLLTHLIDCGWVKTIAKVLFFSCVVFSVLAQCYSILMSVSPMLEAKKRMDRAKKDAEMTLELVTNTND